MSLTHFPPHRKDLCVTQSLLPNLTTTYRHWNQLTIVPRHRTAVNLVQSRPQREQSRLASNPWTTICWFYYRPPGKAKLLRKLKRTLCRNSAQNLHHLTRALPLVLQVTAEARSELIRQLTTNRWTQIGKNQPRNRAQAHPFVGSSNGAKSQQSLMTYKIFLRQIPPLMSSIKL